MTMQDTPWFKGFKDGFSLKNRRAFEDEIDQEEYDQGFFEGREEYYKTIS